MSFYITLISDSSLTFFPNNKISQFTTQLPRPINLNGDWEMAVVDFIYPHTWYNVRNDNNLFGFDLGDGKLEGRRIPPGCYETIPDLIKGMIIPSHKNKIDFHYHPVTKRVKIRTDAKSKVILNEGLAELLGFEPGEYTGYQQSPFVADPKSTFPVMYVYCDLVEPQIVGDVQAPLLKIVTVEGNDGEIVNAQYPRPFYLPVIRQHFQTIHIDIRLHSGDLVPFQRGKVFVMLHFRLRQIL